MVSAATTAFLPAVDPPAAMDANALCFVFRRFDVLVKETPAGTDVPTLDSLQRSGISPGHWHFLGHWLAPDGTRECYAADLGEEVSAPPDTTFLGLRALYGRSAEALFHLAGRAVQIVDWDRTHQYCSRCGTPTLIQTHERARVCPACGLTNYPRLAPAIIVRVQRLGRDGSPEILLARNRRYPGGMYSVLAGFVEPGETLEECVAREIREEVGIEVREITYAGSQPWPFPHSLMVAFTAEYESGELVVDGAELEEARWFTAGELPMTPPPPSIANLLIQDWLLQNT